MLCVVIRVLPPKNHLPCEATKQQTVSQDLHINAVCSIRFRINSRTTHHRMRATANSITYDVRQVVDSRRMHRKQKKQFCTQRRQSICVFRARGKHLNGRSTRVAAGIGLACTGGFPCVLARECVCWCVRVGTCSWAATATAVALCLPTSKRSHKYSEYLHAS